MVNAKNDLSSIITLHLSHPPDTKALALETHTTVFSLQAHYPSIVRLIRQLLPASGRVPTQSCRHLELIDRCLGSCGIYLGLLSAVSMTIPLSPSERFGIHHKLEQWVAIVEWCDAMTSLLECWGCGSAQVCDMHQWKKTLLKQSQEAEASSRKATRIDRSDGKRKWCEVQK